MPNPRASPLATTLKAKLSQFTGPSSSLTPTRKRSFLSWVKPTKPEAQTSGVRAAPKSDDYDEVDQNDYAEGEEMEKVMNQVIFNGGVDYETRPMVIITACGLPDPSKVDYDLLLVRILAYLDLYVEADYSVVFLAAGGRHHPGWPWIWKAYRSLSRKYRKNLKKLYIVHSSWFTKMLFSLAGTVISPKFFRKIEYVATLSQLASLVPITQIQIPAAVYTENLNHEREIVVPRDQQGSHRMFGVALDELMGPDGEFSAVPPVIRDCVAYLRSQGLDKQGLFRRSPSSAILRQLEEAYDRGQRVEIAHYDDPHLAAVLIKKFFRMLPQSIFSEDLYSVIRKCPVPDGEGTRAASIEYVREEVIGGLPGNAQVLINVVMQLLHEVSRNSHTNLMDAYNLALVFTPNLVSNANPLRDLQMCSLPGGPSPLNSQKTSSKDATTTLGMVVKLCIQRYYEIFDEVRDVSEAVEPMFKEATQHSTSGVDYLPSMAGPSTSAATSPPPARSIANSSRPPSAWNKTAAANGGRTRLRPTLSKQVSSPDIASANNGTPSTRSGGSNDTWSMPRSRRSIISIERATGGKPGTGSIRLGKSVPTIGHAGGQDTPSTGTARKGAGATVTAVSVTATGFFAPALGAKGDSGNGEGGVDDRPGAGFEALKRKKRADVRNSFVGAFEEHRS